MMWNSRLTIFGFGICVAVVAAGQLSTGDANGTATAEATAHRGSPGTPDSTHLFLIKGHKADYPLVAQQQRLQGQVMLHILIAEDGKVKSAEALSGDPILSEAALKAAYTWEFAPYIRDGRPVQVSTKIPLDFAFAENVYEVKSSVGNPIGPVHKPVRVSSGVATGLLIHQVAPVYPPEAKGYGMEGTVVFGAIIGKDGRIRDLKVISGTTVFREAAMGAVQQWRYRPYMLMGEPVEVETQITVNFRMRR